MFDIVNVCVCVYAYSQARTIVHTVLGCAECQLAMMPTGVPTGARVGTGRHVNFSVMDRSKRRMRF